MLMVFKNSLLQWQCRVVMCHYSMMETRNAQEARTFERFVHDGIKFLIHGIEWRSAVVRVDQTDPLSRPLASNGVAFHKELAVKVFKSTVEFICFLDIAVESSMDHVVHHVRDNVGRDRDASITTLEDKILRGTIVPTIKKKIFAIFSESQFHGSESIQITSGVLDPDNVLVLGKSGDSFILNVTSSSSRDVVQNQGKSHVSKSCKVLDQGALGRLHIVGSHKEVGIRSHIDRLLCHGPYMLRIDSTCAYEERNLSLDLVDHCFQYGGSFFHGHDRRFCRRAQNA
mmetsp:Transcript_17938/g.34165  ORF Transcript_17938/g.34165 Transcript_17938/m.34165 type:complete len:285 (+) Transcript_17938:43-897(+)